MNNQVKEYQTFAEFYPFYLSEHQDVISRRLHFIGSAMVLLLLAYIIVSGRWLLLLLLPVVGYGFAWIGHFFFEKNKPATFTYPVYSFIGDWVMFYDIIRGKIKIT